MDNEPMKYTIKSSKSYNFEPQDDITVLEAAWISHLFAMASSGNLTILDKYPQWDLIKRHFKEIE